MTTKSNRTKEKASVKKLESSKREIQVGLDSGEGIPAKQVFAEIKKRNKSLRRKQKIKPTNDPDDTLTPEEAESVRRGIEQSKRGEVVPWEQVKKELDL